MKSDPLQWLLNFFSSQCDGDWEHTYGVTIRTIDNPGWIVKIDLYETILADRSMPSVDRLRTEDDWIMCDVRDDKFIGAGGVSNLMEILEVFMEWSKPVLESEALSET
ncbi:immunity 53 family protein [Indioceanicola profundi]|uniref:immunity 53 family protein n=1 Tax=Indioceanicola profundi TaxID=2220096 RepID=UPI000E6AD3AC|nr:immunity 53 family protein [Indioceanicola profundi]